VEVSILIGTWGKQHWADLAQQRALPSAQREPAEVLIEHVPDGCRHEVRNGLAEKASKEWLVFLDADDELRQGYVAGFEHALAQATVNGRRYLLSPSVSYSVPGGPIKQPKTLPKTDDLLLTGNCIVLGSGVQRDLFLEVGGFLDWNCRTGNEFDDWDLWIRCVKAGAKIVQAHRAVYVAWLENTSEHRKAQAYTKLRWQYEIGMTHDPEYYDGEWRRRYMRR
jgi:hypothetical protein